MSIFKKSPPKSRPTNVWARPEMTVIFRAELMPGKNREERTYRIAEVLPNNRVILHDFNGEHRESEFEPVEFKKLPKTSAK